MSNKSPVLWEELTWEEIPTALTASNGTVLFPLGATEQHGPHLGTGVDTHIAERVCHAVSARTRTPVLPALALGCSSGHSRKWPGTVSLSPTTLIAVLSDAGDWLHASGVRRLIFVNSHVTNFAPVRCALEVLRDRYSDLSVALISTGNLSPRTREIFFADAEDWHANAAETSLMLALEPKLTRPGKIAQADDPDRTAGLEFAHRVDRTSQNGVTGSPSVATEEDGHRLFGWMVDDLSERVTNAMREEPPISN